jgi:cysteine desulfurase
MQIYLDNAATTKVCEQAAAAAYSAMTQDYGNPSSTHTVGRQAAKLLESARAQVAAALDCAPEEIFFTSGGTESVNWALLSGAQLMKRQGNHIIGSSAEHSAAQRCLDELEKRGFEVTRLNPQKDGSISVQDAAAALREDTILVSLMAVNNETGGITDISAISREMKRAKSKALLHTDAVQAFLKIPLSAKTLGADLISVSGHKIHAPKGVGALYIRGGGKKINLAPLIVGGAQEDGKRAGTQAMPLIAAFGAACACAKADFEERTRYIAELKELAVQTLTRENHSLQVLSGNAPQILSVSLPGYKSEVLMNYLEARDIFVSKSSACKKGGRSYVLEAAKHSPAVIDGAIRISFSHYNTREEVLAFCASLKDSKRDLYTVLK